MTMNYTTDQRFQEMGLAEEVKDGGFGEVSAFGFWQPRNPDDCSIEELALPRAEEGSATKGGRLGLALKAVETQCMSIDYRGSSPCRLCDVRSNGHRTFVYYSPYGTSYYWPEGFFHYLVSHCITPPIEFLHMLRQVSSDIQERLPALSAELLNSLDALTDIDERVGVPQKPRIMIVGGGGMYGRLVAQAMLHILKSEDAMLVSKVREEILGEKGFEILELKTARVLQPRADSAAYHYDYEPQPWGKRVRNKPGGMPRNVNVKPKNLPKRNQRK